MSRASTSTGRELRYLLLAGGFGLLVLPFVVYLAGATTLGPYDGGISAFLAKLYGDFVRFTPTAWALLLGPYVLFLVVRVCTRPFRHRSAARPARAPTAD